MLFQRNRAGGVGGAAHVACEGLSAECTGLLPGASQAVVLQDNTAGLYSTLNPKPQTLNTKPFALNHTPSTINHTPYTKPQTLNPKPQIPNPKP